MMRTNGSAAPRRATTLLITGLVAVAGTGMLVATQQAQATPGSARAVAAVTAPEPPRPDEVIELEPVPFGDFVPFEGEQAGAFGTASIPQGWTVQAAGDTALVLAPPGADPDPESFLGKIMVSVGVGFPERAPAGAGVVHHNDDGYTMVQIDRSGGEYLAVQFPPTTGGTWTDEQLLEFARGITVGAAQAVAG